jgi:hypothetical protein
MSESEEDAIRRAVKRMTGYKDEADSDEAWEAWFEYRRLRASLWPSDNPHL